mgnify:CR=1 FL=1
MNCIYFKNTKSPPSINNPDVHLTLPSGYAYETATHFVHFYGLNHGLHIISTNMTSTELKNDLTLEQWVEKHFGAKEIESMNIKPGQSKEWVWRPTLFYYNEIEQAMRTDLVDRMNTEKVLRLLIEKLHDLLSYIEPDENGLKVYSHRIRELLILACTEVENFWQAYLKRNGISPINSRNYTTVDYVKLCNPLFLKEYEFEFRNYTHIPPIRPFSSWDAASPTKSLPWFDAYNSTKHDRTSHFNKATLDNAIQAVIANLIMYSVKFSPLAIHHGLDNFGALINLNMNYQLTRTDHKTYYLPLLKPIPYNEPGLMYTFKSHDNGLHELYDVSQIII